MRSCNGISKAQWRKDAPALCIAFCAIAFIPLSIFMLRARPLAAETPGELVSIAREQTAKESVSILARHQNSWNLQSSEARWQEIAQGLCESDNDLDAEEVSGVLQAAKPALAHREWPLYAKRARLSHQNVWLVASGNDAGDGSLFCGNTSPEERSNWKLQAVKDSMSIVVVSAHKPHKVIM